MISVTSSTPRENEPVRFYTLAYKAHSLNEIYASISMTTTRSGQRITIDMNRDNWEAFKDAVGDAINKIDERAAEDSRLAEFNERAAVGEY